MREGKRRARAFSRGEGDRYSIFTAAYVEQGILLRLSRYKISSE